MSRPIDVLHCGQPRVIACWEADGILIDPGPESALETLMGGLGEGFEPRAVLLTHIHLDHAAATGSLLRDWPDTEVWVHQRGARHMADPTKLIASARRIYRDRMDELWGEIAPVPEERIVVLEGGETREGFEVAYTPGHASHHVSFLHPETGIVFAGDVAGVRIEEGPVIPPTPPPDIDLDLWHKSIETLRAWDPQELAIAHFGTFMDVRSHLDELSAALDHWGARARETDATQFEAEMLEAVGTARPYTLAMPIATLHAGLERYWKNAR
jgi:glyoxylase-like metal-dependent hydrolase (beta-lactamase superfamily II)